MLQTIAFAAIALFTTGVIGAVIRPFLQREGIAFTRAGLTALALVICGSSAGISSALFPELPEITASEPVVVVKQEKTRTITKADLLAARATQLANETRERAYRVTQRGAISRFNRHQEVNNGLYAMEQDAQVLQAKMNRANQLVGAVDAYNATVAEARKLGIINADGTPGENWSVND